MQAHIVSENTAAKLSQDNRTMIIYNLSLCPPPRMIGKRSGFKREES